MTTNAQVPDSPVPDFPFDFSLRIATDEEVEAKNRYYGTTRAERMEPTLRAIERIQRQRSATRDRLQSWLFHPDERVVVQALEKVSIFIRTEDYGAGRLVADVAKNLVTSVPSEVLWGTRLDAAFRVSGRISNPNVIGGSTETNWVTERIQGLQRWLNTEPDPGVVRFAFELIETERIRRVFVRHTKKFDAALAKTYLNMAHQLLELRERRHQTRYSSRLGREPVPEMVRDLLDNPNIPAAPLLPFFERWKNDAEVLLMLLGHPALPRELWEQHIPRIREYHRVDAQGAWRQSERILRALITHARGPELNEILEAAPVKGGEVVKHFATRLRLEQRPNDWENASPRAIKAFMKSLAATAPELAWQLLEADPAFYQERLVPNHRWAQYLFVALARHDNSAAIRLVMKAKHPWLGIGRLDVDELLRATYQRAFERSVNGIFPKQAMAALEMVLRWEHPRLALLGPREEVVRSAWRRIAAEYPHDAMSVLINVDPLYEPIRRLPPSEHMAAFVAIGTSDSVAAGTLGRLLYHRPEFMVLPETRHTLANTLKRFDPAQVRSLLAQTTLYGISQGHVDSKEEIVRAIHEADVEALFKLILRDSPTQLQALKNEDFMKHANISPEGLASLLRSDDPEIRQHAIFLAPRLKEREQGEGQEAPRPQRKR